MGNLFQELKRRKVFRVAAVYAVVAWLVVQVIDVVLPTFNAPLWVNQTIILLLILGLPVALVLAWAFDLTPEGIQSAGNDQTTLVNPGSSGLTSAVLAFMALAVGFLLLDRFLLNAGSTSVNGEIAQLTSDDSFSTRVQRTVIQLNGGQQLATAELMPLGVGRNSIAVSPQGTYLAYTLNMGGRTQLALRRMDEYTYTLIPGTEGGFFPFFSTDEQWLGFLTTTQIIKVPVNGGTPQALTDASNVYGAVWGSDGNIVFSEREGVQLSEVSSEGGNKRILLNTVTDYIVSDILPDEKGMLLSSFTGGVTLFSPETNSNLPLGIMGTNPFYVQTGHIVYLRGENFMAVPFDLETLSTTGSSTPILSEILIEDFPHVSISKNGLLAYAYGIDNGITTPVWVDRNGNEEEISLPAQRYGSFRLSPNDSRLTIQVTGAASDIWAYDFSRETPLQRVTTGGNKTVSLWSPDGMDLAFGTVRALNEDVGAGIYQQRLGGGEPSSLVQRSSEIAWPDSWIAPDLLAITQGDDAETSNNIYAIDPTGERQPEVVVATEASEWGAYFSPTGEYIAYTSDESGQYQIYVQPHPPDGNRWLISTGYGEEPVWSALGDEIIYRRGNEWLSVPVRTEGEIEFGVPQILFSGKYKNVMGLSYNLSADAQRFLVLKMPDYEGPSEIRIVNNWFEELRQL